MNSIKRTKPPLTREQLLEIQARSSASSDVRALLWEVARLRGVVLRASDLLRHDRGSSSSHILEQALRRELDEEPAVQEQPKL